MTSIIAKVTNENARHTYVNLYQGGAIAGQLVFDSEHAADIVAYLNKYNDSQTGKESNEPPTKAKSKKW